MNPFYLLIQLTWGLPLNVVGAIVYLFFVKLFKFETRQFRNMLCVIVPWNFGGLNLGMFAILSDVNRQLAMHEYGHSIQNLYWGWLTPFVITLPSSIRYWYREYKTYKGIPLKTGYSDIWFESQADRIGAKAESNTWRWL